MQYEDTSINIVLQECTRPASTLLHERGRNFPNTRESTHARRHTTEKRMEMKCQHSRHTTLKKEKENDRPQCSKAQRQRKGPYAVQGGGENDKG